MLGFLLGVSVVLNILFILGFTATIENIKKEVDDFKKNNTNNIVESYSSKISAGIINACGGINNISECKICVTRLKLQLVDISKVDNLYFETSKYSHFISDNTLQIVIGASGVKSDICYLINTIK